MAVSLDKHEKQIILLLQKDGRMSYVDLARAIGVTEGTVRRKLHRLVTEGIIKVAAVANPHALGFEAPAIIGLKVDLERIDDAVKQLADLPGVRFVALATGNYDVIIEGMWANNEDLSDFILNGLCKVPGVTVSQTSLVLRIVRQTFDWGIPGYTGEGEP